MGFYKNLVIDMVRANVARTMYNVPGFVARRAAASSPFTKPVRRVSMSSDTKNHGRDPDRKHENSRPADKDGRGNARAPAPHVSAPRDGRAGDTGSDRDRPESEDHIASRSGDHSDPSLKSNLSMDARELKAPVLLLHRRRRDTNLRREFDTEDEARIYAKEHKLLLVHSEKKGDQLCLYYLPD